MAGFLIDSREYEVPTLESFNMGEAMILEEYSGLTLNQFSGDGVMSVGVAAALMHVAYAREHPGMKKQEIRALIEASNLVDALEALSDEDGEDDAGPPAVTATTGSPPNSATTRNGSGEGSPSVSAAPPVEDLRATGTPV